MARVSSKDQIKASFAKQEQGLRDYFPLMIELIDNISSPEPALAYCFQRIEMAQRGGLYALLMREYRTDSALAWGSVDRLDLTRSNFPSFYRSITGKKLPATLHDVIAPAEKVRDDITHGRQKTGAEIHGAILKCLDYAKALNDAFHKHAGFRPVGPLRGVTSKRGKPLLEKKLTRLVLKGLDFPT